MQRLSQSGDRDALALLVLRHQAGVLRYCSSLCRDQASAEDALQQTFLDLMRGAQSGAKVASFRPWLFTLARNACFRGARLRAGEPRNLIPLEQLGAMAGWGESPEKAAARQLDRERLTRALNELPAQSKEVVVLRDLEGLSGEQVAEMLNITLAAQKSRLHRARLELSAKLIADERVPRPKGSPNGP
jgi:RNA polymerase sigma-70 factor (ECF subfamily)